MFKSLNGGLLPQRATKYSAAFDVFANEDVVIDAGETKLVGIGIYLHEDGIREAWFKHFPNCGDYHTGTTLNAFYLELHPRSSLRLNGLGGGVGIIDMDYKDEIKMVITNPYDRQERYTVKKDKKIGQILLKRHEGWLFPAEYTKDEERTGGFGSTDNKIDEKNVNASKMMGIIK